MMQWKYRAAEVKHDGMVGTVATLGTFGTYTSAFQKMRSQVECNFRLGQLRQRSTAADIFTTGDMVVGETITIDHLVSVYQGDANAVSDEGTIQKKQRTSLFYILTSCEYARITLYLQQCHVTNRRRLDSISRQKGATA